MEHATYLREMKWNRSFLRCLSPDKPRCSLGATSGSHPRPFLQALLGLEYPEGRGAEVNVILTRMIRHTQKGENIRSLRLLDVLIDACVMESYFREHMAERDLLFHDTVAPYLGTYDPAANENQQRDFLTRLHQTLNAPSHPIRNRRLRLTADSPDLLAVIKKEGRV